eukprot:CAMPEP_0175174300 /NCGR_PEP_ID=MMETSP0087-20121206/32550_1 /TAXON_ID=136419 /ORGANISM="Unknown Unknown, Strain D1" /LENGTH=140 /DNA_ID=CAMNT_0016465743 /DNA_START=124 /DNA_END=542 /DNA_ORIENTATION=+
MTKNFVLTHILTPAPPGQFASKQPGATKSKTEGLICPECFQESFADEGELQSHWQEQHADRQQYMTLNGRQVFVHNNVVVTGQHFAHQRSSAVLYEEQCYNDDFEPFRVMLISVPLVGKIAPLLSHHSSSSSLSSSSSSS